MREIKFRVFHKSNKLMLYTDNICITIGEDYWTNTEGNGMILMQSTGLTDINGKEWYEGDVCDENMAIRWVKEKASFEFYWLSDNETCDGDLSWWEAPEFLKEKEVLGNVYENPELIEV